MCGIAGIIKLSGEITPQENINLIKALRAQSHRGPDALMSWSNNKVALGHNRLSIVDLSTDANQPFHRDDLKLSIIFNGEIYNYQSLKSELIKEGYHFVTSSDTEVLLVGYHLYRQSICEKLVGMFSFVIYDQNGDEVFAARDRFGEKPFLFIQTSDTLFFASELKSLQYLYSKELTINQDAVIDLMENMYINLHHTIYHEVQVFPPASQLYLSKGKVMWREYYSFPKEVTSFSDFDELKLRVKNQLYESVAAELHADVPVATFLSSGIDSSVISAIAKEIKPDILSITMSTGDHHTDEADQATSFARKLGIRQEIVEVSSDSLEVLSRQLETGQPLADASLIPTYLVTKAVAGHTKVMLSGDGGDEVFGSYNKPNLYLKYGERVSMTSSLLFSGLEKVSGKKYEKYFSDKNRMKLGGWKGIYSKTNLNFHFDQVFTHGQPIAKVKSIADKLQIQYKDNPEKLSFGVDMLSRLPGDFLYKVDTSSMHNSIEVRAPFLDHRLVDLSLRSDINSLMPNRIDKELTRALYKEFAGIEHQGSKKGFSIPYMNYLKGEWGIILEKLLKEGLSEKFFHLNKKGLLAMVDELRATSAQSLARILYSVLVLEIWLRVFHLDQDLELFLPND